MADGQRFHQHLVTAASRSYPLGSLIRVTVTDTGRTLDVRVTDRGPWNPRYKLDLSRAAWKALGLNPAHGWAWVSVTRISPEIF